MRKWACYHHHQLTVLTSVGRCWVVLNSVLQMWMHFRLLTADSGEELLKV